MAQFVYAVTREVICCERDQSGISCTPSRLEWVVWIVFLSVISTEKRYPPRIKHGAGFFPITR